LKLFSKRQWCLSTITRTLHLRTGPGVAAPVSIPRRRLSLGGLTGTLKNPAQAMLKRLRQDSYTDLVAIAVQTAPPPPRKSDLHKALKNRRLTAATPN
jgi:hypothetical protein